MNHTMQTLQDRSRCQGHPGTSVAMPKDLHEGAHLPRISSVNAQLQLGQSSAKGRDASHTCPAPRLPYSQRMGVLGPSRSGAGLPVGTRFPGRIEASPGTPAPPTVPGTLVPATSYLFILYMQHVFNISNPIITKFINRVRWSERLLAGEICL